MMLQHLSDSLHQADTVAPEGNGEPRLAETLLLDVVESDSDSNSNSGNDDRLFFSGNRSGSRIQQAGDSRDNNLEVFEMDESRHSVLDISSSNHNDDDEQSQQSLDHVRAFRGARSGRDV